MENKIGFWKVDEPYGFLSNWYLCNFELNGVTFNSSEQCFMYNKALLFGAYDIAEAMLRTNSQREIKALGRQIKNFNPTIWNKEKYALMLNANRAKYKNNPELCQKLLATNNAELFEASPLDAIWGIGTTDVNNPKGENLLGKCLMEVRKELNKE